MSRILNSAFVWIGSATHDTSDAFRQRQRERIRRMQNNDAETSRGRIDNARHAGMVDHSASPLNPDSVHFSVEHPDGTVTDYGLKPSPFARKEGK